MKLKNQKQRDIRSFVRSYNDVYSYGMKKIFHLNFCCCFFCPKNPKPYIADT